MRLLEALVDEHERGAEFTLRKPDGETIAYKIFVQKRRGGPIWPPRNLSASPPSALNIDHFGAKRAKVAGVPQTEEPLGGDFEHCDVDRFTRNTCAAARAACGE